MSRPTLLDGICAVNKPPGKSSAQVIRDLQSILTSSRLFASESPVERAHSHHSGTHFRRRDGKVHRPRVKIGHGGTLDPMATGVLVLGLGNGTKLLHNFLNCTKTYEATVMFGAATDSYDTDGKILKRASCAHLTQSKVAEALSAFRGKIMQRPPLYSALKMDGKRLCDYAREGKEIPREIAKRSVVVDDLQLIEWLPPGTHSFRLPLDDADTESREIAENVLGLGDFHTASAETATTNEGKFSEEITGSKRRRLSGASDDHVVKQRRSSKPIGQADDGENKTGENQVTGITRIATNPDRTPTPEVNPPAARLRMTVSSGFYVRSLAHDVGEAVGSLACMCDLVRTRQAIFELGSNVLGYEDFHQNEDVWVGKLREVLRKDIQLQR